MSTISIELNRHIKEKILYHQKLRKQLEAQEKYEDCIPHRDEIKRLHTLLE
jgi:protein-arginine kinase activator protein McsA